MSFVGNISPGEPDRLLGVPKTFANTSFIGQVTLLGVRSGGIIEALVPPDLIYTEDVPVDASHVRELRRSIEEEADKGNGNGQLASVLLAHTADRDQMPIIDGFHRISALQAIGAEAISATIRTGSTLADVYDLRIIAATSHKSVKFARVIEWAQEAWQQSEWSDRLTASQAFSFGFNPRMSGANLDIRPDEVEAIRIWLAQKSEQWQIKPGTIYNYLATARRADPKLVQAAREGSKKEVTELSPQHIAAIARALPGPENYDRQNRAALVVRTLGLSTPQTRTFVASLAHAASPAEEDALVADTLQGTAKIPPNYTDAEKRQQGAQPAENIPLLRETLQIPEYLQSFFENELEIALLTIENAILIKRHPAHITQDLFRRVLQYVRPEVSEVASKKYGERSHPLKEKIANGHAAPVLPPPEYITHVKRMLPRLLRDERRALVLSLFFNAPSTLIEQVLLRNPEEVRELLLGARTKLFPGRQTK